MDPKTEQSGDIFNMSGDFRGAIINIKSTMQNVQQSVGDLRTDNEAARAELMTLVEQLNQALQSAPPEKIEQAQAVAETAKALVDTARAEKPNQTLLQITGEGLKAAAQNLVEVMPAVVTIASQIVLAVGRLIPGLV